MSIVNAIGTFFNGLIGKYAVFHNSLPPFIYGFFNTLFYTFLFIGFLVSFVYLCMSLGVLIMGKEKKEETLEESKLPFVTVQIPTKNEIIALRCAKKCLEFDYPKNRYEIIIGDDSTDKSVSRKLNEFAAKHPHVKVTRRKETTGFKPANLNNMLKYTKGEIIVLFDSDFAPAKDFLRRIVVPFKDKKVSAVQARWKFINADKNFVTALASTIVYTFHHVSLSLLKRYNTGFLCGSAEAVRKSDLIRYGGWKSGSLTEDIEYSLRIHKNGKSIYYLPDLECFNEAPSRPLDLYKQQMRWAYGVISAYKEHTKDILTTNIIPARQKLLTMVGSFGYIFPVVILMIFFTGLGSFLTHKITVFNWGEFLFETGRNTVLTAGLLVASCLALYKAKKTNLVPKMLLSSFSLGLVVTYYVNKGIAKAFLNKPMQWYLLKKSTRVR